MIPIIIVPGSRSRSSGRSMVIKRVQWDQSISQRESQAVVYAEMTERAKLLRLYEDERGSMSSRIDGPVSTRLLFSPGGGGLITTCPPRRGPDALDLLIFLVLGGCAFPTAAGRLHTKIFDAPATLSTNFSPDEGSATELRSYCSTQGCWVRTVVVVCVQIMYDNCYICARLGRAASVVQDSASL